MAEEDILVRAARGTGALGSQNILTSILGLVFFMFFARIVSKTEMGVYGAVFLVYTILTYVGCLGLNFAASHFIPHFYGKNKIKKIHLTIKYILAISVISAGIICFIQIFFAENFSFLLFGTEKYGNLFWITAFAVLLTIIGLVFDGFLSGFQKFESLALFRLTSQILRVGVTIWLLLLGVGVAAVFMGWIVFYLLFTVLAIFLILKTILKFKVEKDENDPFQPKILVAFSLPMMVYQLVTYLSDSVDRFIVLEFLGTESLGIYTVTLMVVGTVIMIVVTSLLITLIPGLSEIHARTGLDKISNSIRISSRYIAMVFIPICLGLAVLSPLAIHILAGLTYWESILPLSIVCIGLSFYGFSATIISALAAIGKTLRVAVAVLLAALTEFGFCVFLIPLMGVVGAAVSRTLMYILMFGLLVFLTSKIVQINFDTSALWKSSVSAVIMASLLFPLAFYTKYSLILLPFYIIFGLIVYGLILIMLKTLNFKDLRFIAKIFPKGEILAEKALRIIKRSPKFSRFAKKFLEEE
ncbi:MAG: hypothetical protein B6U77_00710 [Candidatus Hecatellales archaeon ex4484_218]|nr:MAG: hypothetical protein B6U77_00710 [Candidatus Hecatellales archaeon ex4484_218]